MGRPEAAVRPRQGVRRRAGGREHPHGDPRGAVLIARRQAAHVGAMGEGGAQRLRRDSGDRARRHQWFGNVWRALHARQECRSEGRSDRPAELAWCDDPD